MTALIEVSAVRPLVADLDVSDDTVGATIEDISAFARFEAGEAGTLWDKDASGGSTVPEVVQSIVRTAAARRLRHGDASYERLGEFGHGVNLPMNGSVFTDYELRKIHSYRVGGSGGLTSIRLTRPGIEEALTATPIYLPVDYGGQSIPWTED